MNASSSTHRWAARTTGLVAFAALVGGCAAPMPPSGPSGRSLAAIDQAMAPAARPSPPSAPAVPDAVREQISAPAAPAGSAAAWIPEPRFNLSVSNAPAAQVFLAIAADTRYSMLLPPDLPGQVTISLKEVTVREALEALRDLYGYEYKIDGRRITVLPQGIQTRIFKVNYLSVKREGRSDVRVSSGSLNATPPGSVPGTLPGQVPGVGGATGPQRAIEASRLVTLSDNDLWATLGPSLQAIVGTEGGRSVIVSPMSGVIVVRATPAELRQVERFLRAKQLAIERQVMLEAKIVEVSLREGFQAGINWSAFDSSGRHRGSLGADTSQIGVDRSAAGATLAQLLGAGVNTASGRTGPGLFGLAFQTGSFQALIQFLESQGNVQVLSSPRIATLNNQKAVLKVGTDDFFVTNVSTSTVSTGAGTTSSPTITVQPFFSGIALDVTPQIDDEGAIILHVHPSVSTVSERAKNINLGTLGTFTLPLASSNINESDSIVRVPDGNIAAIGGLMSTSQEESRAQVPGAGDLPVLGGLFGNRSRSFAKRELVILIKPTVIRSERDWADDLGATRARMSQYAPPPEPRPALQ